MIIAHGDAWIGLCSYIRERFGSSKNRPSVVESPPKTVERSLERAAMVAVEVRAPYFSEAPYVRSSLYLAFEKKTNTSVA